LNWECCWAKEKIAPDECPHIAEGEKDLCASLEKRVVEKCVECPRFKNDLRKLRDMGYPLSGILPYILAEFAEQRAQLLSMGSFLDSKTREINFLHELGVVLQTSLDLDEVLSVAMTAITAGKGFAMNRAFLLLADKERQFLEGYLGVGPRTYEEAWQTWADIDRNNFTLKEMARQFYDTKLASEKVKFHDLLERLTIPLADEQHILNRVLNDSKPVLVENAADLPALYGSFAEVLGSSSFIIVPLISRKRRIGLIIADNCFTHKPITLQDLQSLETFSFPVAFAIERASLYERLQEEVDKLTSANLKLQEQQELIVKMEKMALVGKITSNIAHSIRNPLMIIGGFARSLLKTVAEQDPKREYLESIVRETRQLEEVLGEVLTYSDSLYPTMDRWDVNQLVSNVWQGLSEKFQERQIQCLLELSPDLPTVYIDYKQISYCLRTILNDSVEAIAGAGEIRLATLREENYVILTIRDSSRKSGLQAGETAASHPFPRQESASSLGLPLCATIFEKNGMPFAVDYGDAGMCVTIKLPIKREA